MHSNPTSTLRHCPCVPAWAETLHHCTADAACWFVMNRGWLILTITGIVFPLSYRLSTGLHYMKRCDVSERVCSLKTHGWLWHGSASVTLRRLVSDHQHQSCVLQGAIYVTDNAAYSWAAAVQETVDATLNRTVSSGESLL